MTARDFKPALEQIVARYNSAYEDGELCVHDYLNLTADGCEVLESICRDIGDNDTEFNQLVSDVEWAVREFVVPLDLTRFKIPRFLEQYIIDPQLVSLVRPLLESLRPAPHDSH